MSTRDRHQVLPDANFDGPALLQEQTDLLSDSTPSEINFLHFLKLRLTAQQRATAQRNYWHRVQQQQQQREGGGHSGLAATTSSAASSAIPTVGAGEHGAASAPGSAAWNVHTTPLQTAAPAAVAAHGSRSPMTEASVHSAGTASRPAAFEDVPASAARRAVTRDAAALATPSSFVLDGRGTVLDEKPAVASGMPQPPAGVAERQDVALEPCPHCGRTFAPERLQRHATTCERQQLTGTKAKGGEGRERKTSSGSTSSSVRLERGAAAAATSTASGTSASAKSSAPAAAAAPGAGAKTEKWRRQSAQLRNALAGASAVDDDRVQCPSCGRRFAEEAAERHIPICKAKEARHA